LKEPIHFRVRDLLLLGAVTLVAHGMLLLNDGIYWDDWVIYPHLTGGDWSSINALIHDSGMTQVNATFLDAFAYLPGGVFSVKLAVFALIVAIAWFVYLIGLEAGLGRLEAWLVAALATVFPGFQDWVLLVTASSVFDFALFLAATFLLLRAERAGPARNWLRATAVIGFVLSFSLSSLLALYLGVLFLLLLVSLRSASAGEHARSRWLYALVLVALPVAFWLASRALYAVNGLYLGANSFVTSPGPIATAAEHFVGNGIAAQARQAAGALLRPWTWPALGLVLVLVALGWRRARAAAAPPSRVVAAGLAVGVLSLGLAILPYAAVGKFPSIHGWETRHDLLVGVPMAVLLVLVVRAVLPAGRPALLGVGLLGVIAVGFVGADIQNYSALQARWADDRAVMLALHNAPASGNYSVYWVSDGAPGPEDFYRFYEWSAMFGQVYGGQTRIGLDTREYDATILTHSEYFIDRFDLASLDPRGCQADLVITNHSATTAGGTALTYTYYRLFKPAQLNTYLDGLVTVEVRARVSAQGTDCPS
jgi:hypothetical protein